MSIFMMASISPFFPLMMARRPCYEQAVMAWITHCHWQHNRPATLTFLCENAGTSQKRVSEAIQVLMNDGLIAEERITETRVGYIPTIAVLSAQDTPKQEDHKEVVKDGVDGGGVLVGDTKGKEEGRGKAGKREAKPPELSTIEAVCKSRGWTFDPKSFYEYYAKREWTTLSNIKITSRNWYHVGVQWAEREAKRKAGVRPNTPSHEDATA